MRTTMRTAVAALALATVVAGCGRGDGTEEVAVVRDLDLMQGVEAAGSARVALTLDIELMEPDNGDPTDGPDTPSAVRIQSTAEGVMGFPDGDVELAGESTVEGEGVANPAPGVVQHAETRRVDGRTWVRLWNEGEEVPAWLETPSSSAPGSGLAQDPAAFLARLRDEADAFTEIGSDEVRGDATTHHRAEVDREAIDGGETLWGADAGDEVSVDVWIDDQGRLRRVEAGGLELELWDFGVVVDVEVPEDVQDGPDMDSAFDAMDEALPQVEGEWSERATGTTSGAEWSVFEAPGSLDGEATTCRTFEIGDDVTAELPEAIGELPVAMHGTTFATCGNGTVAATVSGFIADPDVQVLIPMEDDPPALVAFVIAPDRAAGGIRLVRAGADPVELGVDATGVAVWDGTGSPAVTAVELDGGALTCSFTEVPGIPGSTDGGGFTPGDPLGAAGVAIESCSPR